MGHRKVKKWESERIEKHRKFCERRQLTVFKRTMPARTAPDERSLTFSKHLGFGSHCIPLSFHTEQQVLIEGEEGPSDVVRGR